MLGKALVAVRAHLIRKFACAGRVYTPTDAPMGRSRRDLSKAPRWAVCVPLDCFVGNQLRNSSSGVVLPCVLGPLLSNTNTKRFFLVFLFFLETKKIGKRKHVLKQEISQTGRKKSRSAYVAFLFRKKFPRKPGNSFFFFKQEKKSGKIRKFRTKRSSITTALTLYYCLRASV